MYDPSMAIYYQAILTYPVHKIGNFLNGDLCFLTEPSCLIASSVDVVVTRPHKVTFYLYSVLI